MVSKGLAYFPGCSLKGSAREYDVSTRLVCRVLGIELSEIPDWVCCGASSAHVESALLATTLSAHALVRAARMGLPLMSPCALCFARFRQAALDLKDEATRLEVEHTLGEKIGELPPVVHLLQALEAVNIPVRQPLRGLRVASYYGCLLVRPVKVTGLDDAENPTLMDKLVSNLGAEAVPWAFKTECCGAGLVMPLPGLVKQLSGRVGLRAKEAGAEALVVACPMCHANLDLYAGAAGSLPVFYISQLIGLALGFSPEELRLNRHLINPVPLLKAKGLAGNGEDRRLSVSLRP